jgi:hypothetical protein
LDHQNPLTSLILVEPLNKPVVKAADFDHRHVRFASSLQLLAKIRQFRPPRADLAAEHNVAMFVAKRYRHLLAMEVDSKVQHGRFSWFAALHAAEKKFWRAPVATPFNARRTFFSSLS